MAFFITFYFHMRIINIIIEMYHWVIFIYGNLYVSKCDRLLLLEYKALLELREDLYLKDEDLKHIDLCISLLDIILFEESIYIHIKEYSNYYLAKYINCKIYKINLSSDVMSVVSISKNQQILYRIRRMKAINLYNRIRMMYMYRWDIK